MPVTAESLATIALSLLDREDVEDSQLFRLVGVGLSNFRTQQEPPLFVLNAVPQINEPDLKKVRGKESAQNSC